MAGERGCGAEEGCERTAALRWRMKETTSAYASLCFQAARCMGEVICLVGMRKRLVVEGIGAGRSGCGVEADGGDGESRVLTLTVVGGAFAGGLAQGARVVSIMASDNGCAVARTATAATVEMCDGLDNQGRTEQGKAEWGLDVVSLS